MKRMNKDLACLSDFYKKSNNRIYGLYECFCGKVFSCYVYDVGRKHTKSCGCLSKEIHKKRLTTHGKKHSLEYVCWMNMRQRCNDKKTIGYLNYGKRGITVCDTWQNSFEAFYKDMGPHPGKGYSIDRIDNNKGYSKDNCRWATRKQQNNNQRSNRIITFNGKTQNLTSWSKELHINFDTLRFRLDRYKWPVEKAFTTAVTKKKIERELGEESED